jgi:Na+/H+ antiporter NhaC
VFGDHISPISDTTILASAGAQCDHVDHVSTQLPYAILIASIAVVSYLIAGLCVHIGLGSVLSGVIMWAATLAIFAGIVVFLKLRVRNKSIHKS